MAGGKAPGTPVTVLDPTAAQDRPLRLGGQASQRARAGMGQQEEVAGNHPRRARPTKVGREDRAPESPTELLGRSALRYASAILAVVGADQRHVQPEVKAQRATT